jgi:hypothetical protein
MTFVIQTTGDLTQKRIRRLSWRVAQAKNIFWQVAGRLRLVRVRQCEYSLGQDQLISSLAPPLAGSKYGTDGR